MKYQQKKLIKLIKYTYKVNKVNEESIITMEEILSDLNEKEETILSLRFGLIDGNKRTYKSIGKEYNVSPQRIWQIVNKSIKKLRHIKRRTYVLIGE